MSNPSARTVRAAVFTKESGAHCEFLQLKLAAPQPGELVIKVGASGICHTDIAVAGYTSKPAVLGHETAGEIVEIGAGVKGFQIGDRIAATFGYCGHCQTCQDGDPAYCVNHEKLNFEGVTPSGAPSLQHLDGTPVFSAFFQQSGFADHAIVQAASSVRLPDSMDFAHAAPLGCGIQTGAGAVLRSMDCQSDRSLVVFGVGTVGIAAIMAAKLRGCAPIIAVDLDEHRLELSKRYGTDHVLNGQSQSLVEDIRNITGGAHYSLEGTGNAGIYQAAINCLRPKGICGTLAYPGPYGEPVSHPGGMAFMSTRQVGIIEGDSNPKEFLPELIALQESGKLPYEKLVTTYPFEDINQALDDLRARKIIKPVLIF